MGVKQRAAANPRNRRARDGHDSGEDRFPWLVSIACLFAGLYLFLSSTVPALREQRELRETELIYRQAVERVGRQTIRQRRRWQRLPHDPEIILVEFDRQGILPETALQRYPELSRGGDSPGRR